MSGRNPFLLPMWLMLAVALIISWLINVPGHTFVGFFAYIPWLITVASVIIWERKHPV